MTRPGCFSKFSRTLIGFSAFGIGSKTKLLANNGGCFDGIGGGFIRYLVLVFCLEKEMLKRAPDCFVEISAKWIVAEKLHGQTRRADERPQIPCELRPEKKIAAEPTKYN